MFRNLFAMKTILATALLVYPCSTLAQHGGATGGGPAAGGGGLSGGGGRASGVAVSDDLKGFHAVLALQATSQQIAAYNLMVKSAAEASAELQSFLQQLETDEQRSALAGFKATIEDALEKARTENKQFLDGLSDPQKTGLKEIAKKLTKADFDLAQRAKALDQEVIDPKGNSKAMATSAQNLEEALTAFRNQQNHLGEELSIPAAGAGPDSTFNLAPLKKTVLFANQAVAITTSGTVAKGAAAENGQRIFKLELAENLADLQDSITDVLRAQLDKSNRCGERIAVQNATLSPRDPASVVTLGFHFERWACFGRETMNEMVEGNGTLEVKLTPSLGNGGELRLTAEIGHVDAEGMIGEMLRSGALGEGLRDRVAASVLSAVQKGIDLNATLPPAAQDSATIRRAQFQGTGSGKLIFVLEGEIRVSNDKVTALTSELKGQSPSQETVQDTVPR